MFPRPLKLLLMLSDYIHAAMGQARYEVMENGRYYGSIKSCRGCWAEAQTLEKCRHELQGVLEDWLLLGLQMGHRLPVINGINLNPKTRARMHAQTRKA
jgi:predicted RNase H-like HicB family nuclease